MSEVHALTPTWVRVAWLGEQSAKRLAFRENLSDFEVGRRVILAPLALATDSQAIIPKARKTALVDVVLPEALVLKRIVTAPVKAKRKMSSLAALDLKRNTPFPNGTIMSVLGQRSTAGDTVRVPQYVAKASDLAALRRRLNECGLKGRRFLIEDEGKSYLLQDLSAEVAPGERLWKTINAVIASACIATGGYIWLKPAFDAKKALSEIETDLAELRTGTVAQRKRLDALRAQRDEENQLESDFANRPRLVETLRDVTVVVGDDTWLTAMQFSPTAITLSGETSGTAVDLVLKLSEKSQFTNPRVSGPTTRTSSGREKFEIAASPKGLK